mgnify:FL=1
MSLIETGNEPDISNTTTWKELFDKGFRQVFFFFLEENEYVIIGIGGKLVTCIIGACYLGSIDQDLEQVTNKPKMSTVYTCINKALGVSKGFAWMVEVSERTEGGVNKIYYTPEKAYDSD